MQHLSRVSAPLLAAPLLAVGLAFAALGAAATPAAAQGFFMPGQQAKPAARTTTRPAAPRHVVAPPPEPPPAPPLDQASNAPPPQQALPPPPDLQPLPRGPTPPAAVIGVIGVPDVMHASAAATQIEKIIGERKQRLNDDAQREQGAWRDMQQALVDDRGKLSADQTHARERALQERITNSQRIFRDRGRIIQEAAQYALAQIERTLIAVIRQVADSRGMNLVLHRQQVALNVNEFDITEQVSEQMNKILPSVVIPPDGVEPPVVPPPGAASVILPPAPKTPAAKTPASKVP